MLKLENLTLTVAFSPEVNRAGQRPLTICVSQDGKTLLKVFGVRFCNGAVLDSMASLPGGKFVRHTEFSPELQTEIHEARKKEAL